MKRAEETTQVQEQAAVGQGAYPDWAAAAAFQAYYGQTGQAPPGYYPAAAAAAAAAASGSQAHPYMAWGGQMMSPYGTPGTPYGTPMYPHSAMYTQGAPPYMGYQMPSQVPGQTEDQTMTPGADGQKAVGAQFGAQATPEGAAAASTPTGEQNKLVTPNGMFSSAGATTAGEGDDGDEDDDDDDDGDDGQGQGGAAADGGMPVDYWSGMQQGQAQAGAAGAGGQVPAQAGALVQAGRMPKKRAGALAQGGEGMGLSSDIWMHQDERELKRQRRKQSNRESARRSRLRKQAECEDLTGHITMITDENLALKAELQRLQEACQGLAQRNSQLEAQLGGKAEAFTGTEGAAEVKPEGLEAAGALVLAQASKPSNEAQDAVPAPTEGAPAAEAEAEPAAEAEAEAAPEAPVQAAHADVPVEEGEQPQEAEAAKEEDQVAAQPNAEAEGDAAPEAEAAPEAAPEAAVE